MSARMGAGCYAPQEEGSCAAHFASGSSVMPHGAGRSTTPAPPPLIPVTSDFSGTLRDP